MEYRFLTSRGALNEMAAPAETGGSPEPAFDLDTMTIPAAVLKLVPEVVVREHKVLPLSFDGETIVLASVNADNIALADRLGFLLAKNVRLVPVPLDKLTRAIKRYFGRHFAHQSEDSCLHEFTETALEATAGMRQAPAAPTGRHPGLPTLAGQAPRNAKIGWSADADLLSQDTTGLDPTSTMGAQGMFFYIVDEGQQVLMRRPNGTMEVIVGPKRVWRGRNTFVPLSHFVAHPNEFLIVRHRDGRQEHLPGPAEVWFDPRTHVQITKENALQLAAKEAVVVYSQPEGNQTISRRIVYGPASFVPRAGEWLHTFSWHASKGGSHGVAKVPNALVFQKLWLMPDQMYHDVHDVRTTDDAVLTIRLMIFFELADIDRMLDATHDPIGDFVNAATSDVVAFTSQYDFEQFKRNTARLNELETYRQLTNRATQCGYRITKVVYRGYSAADALQQMHDQAIQARTRLQLDRATEQQAQDLENYKLECQLNRASKRRSEQLAEVEHELVLARQRQEADLQHQETQQEFHRATMQKEAELQLAIRGNQDSQLREHLLALRDMSVDLTAYLTQARADQVIEFRGSPQPHIHLEKALGLNADGKNSGMGKA